MPPFFPAAYTSLNQVWFLRVYRAFDLMWRSGVVLHDRGSNQTINYQLIWLEAPQVFRLH